MSQIASIHGSQSDIFCMHSRAGAFVLTANKALALRPKTPSRIRITCGSAWVTINDGCDYFLTADQEMAVPAGSHVVMESMLRGGQLKFDWQPVMQAASERRPLEISTLAISPLAQALRDLRGAADLAVRGLTGLATALAAGLARGLAIGFAAFARSAHSSASRAQGRMASCESIASSGAV